MFLRMQSQTGGDGVETPRRGVSTGEVSGGMGRSPAGEERAQRGADTQVRPYKAIKRNDGKQL